MRIIHTSDWHLGASLGGVAREREHAAFFEWLIATMQAEAVDVLVVAGDVFDTAQPSSEAQALYYGFLARLGAAALADRRSYPRHVVVVGGNHDSASRLDAPRELLGALNVTVVGGYERGREGALLVPVADPEGATLGVVAAVPYINEYRLGVTVRDADQASAAAEAFGALHTRLAEAACERWPDVPHVITGHLTCSTQRKVEAHADDAAPTSETASQDVAVISEDDFPQPIHNVGNLGALPPGIFDARWDYVALGHIHRAFPPSPPRIWYSGTPVAVGFTEDGPRRVLLVDLDAPGVPARVRPLEVPRSRALVRLMGDEGAVLDALRTCRGDLSLPPLVDIAVNVPIFDAGLPRRLRTCLEDAYPDASDAPVVTRVRQLAPQRSATVDAAVERVRRTMAPRDIFAVAWEAQYGAAPDAEVLASFESLWADVATAEGDA